MARVSDLLRRQDRPAARVAPRRGPSVAERIGRYFREIRAELNRVTWPTRQELIASTLVVIVVVTIMALYLGAWDAVFTWLFQRVLVR
ncbi:MAG: preprotein translocase subunit SecE [Armatimonadota bacterium]|nr:preprotein translocase subunit SecE [Armatimonadota bacterium]